MRTSDLLALALSALAQQKLRTLLTTLGIVFGTIMLVVSLSLRKGVQDAIIREYSRHSELRQIEVGPGRASAEDEAPVEVRGTMSDARRERLRKELNNRQPRSGLPASDVRLTPERLQALAELPHVVSVRPVVMQRGRAILGDRAEYVATLGVAPSDDRLRDRLVAGELLDRPDGHEALVSEYLLYQLGVVNEADAVASVGKTFRVAYRVGERPSPDVLLTLLYGGGGPLAVPDEKLLGKLIQRLPQAVTKLDLPASEQKAILKLLKRRPPPRKNALPEGQAEETLTIRGVLRPPEKEDRKRGSWMYRQADVLLPQRTAEELFLRMPAGRLAGFDQAIVEVDDVDHVKEVNAQVRELKLDAQTVIEWIEREQFVYVLVFGSMAVMAVLALIVSALGIMNVMLMSVLERVREIGVMKAVGARDRHILGLFLFEGALVGLVGGCLGLLLSWGASFPADMYLRGMVERRLNVRLTTSIFSFPWWLLVGAPLFATLVTTIAALAPARRAVRVDPIAALRHE